MAKDVRGTVYVLHFSERISAGHTCQHYVGWAADVDSRIEDHRAGRGARLTQVARERGITFEVVMTFPGTREDERKIKRRKNTPKLCSRCRCPV